MPQIDTIDPAAAVSYRIPMRVVSIRCFRRAACSYSYPVCPRCHITLDREYQSFCDRCGQALSWTRFARAEIISDP